MTEPITRRSLVGALALGLAALATGCDSGHGPGPAPGPSGGQEGSTGSTAPGGAGDPPPSGAPYTLRVLAGSELQDLQPVLDDVRKATGVSVRFTYTGTLDGAATVSSGKADGTYDALWFGSNHYLRLDQGAAGKLLSETSVMVSPVALGVRSSVLATLGWDPAHTTWSQVGQAVAANGLTFGMTDPSQSNSGFSALIGLAAAFSGAQAALTQDDVAKATPALRGFFAGQQLTSGSSGWLAQAYQRAARGGAGRQVGALVNYESVLLSLNRTLPTDAQLTVIRPADGVVSADYPLTLLSSAGAGARDAFSRLTAELLRPEVQRQISDTTERRPVVPGVAPGPGLGTDRRPELPFPGSRAVADALLAAYQNQLRRPSRTVYVLDTSGSMQGARLDGLKQALGQLTGADGSPAANGFREREEVTLISFADDVKWEHTHQVPDTAPQAELASIEADVQSLSAGGGTAIYSTLEHAYQLVAQQQAAARDDRFTSIVLMTDGESNEGDSADGFTAFYRALPTAQQTVPVFPILFGEGALAQLQGIADTTGGKLFDATAGPSALDGVFEEIRGYQ
ncbi:substrate-binding and VWA domain-containing protein [Kitasatospora sp. NBC_01287]|uniref:VWA domain-containing protein n=1 Tax=Kitasatospora sp. NBC_01287 TaxID=2903573 RepID=UPI00225BD7D1|nr:VWA domain-containing protein [Kitasatospora sp. NBC_01287]MCX4749685.1 substrate-binding and VWA domain-containing protein [Kitasatospora sp. NBC_01287]